MTHKIGIVGAGSVGCFVGGCLMMARPASAVTFYGRPGVAEQLMQWGLRISDFRGLNQHFPVDELDFSTSPSALADADTLFITVKSAATAEVAEQLRGVIRPGATVISLQNGVGNADTLAHGLPDHRVLPGMIAFNVLQMGDGRFHAGTDGAIMIQRDRLSEDLPALFVPSRVPVLLQDNMHAVLWSKLLLNLNNAVNALSGIPLKAELSQRGYRCCLAMLQREAMQVMRAAGIPMMRLTGIPPRWLPRLLDTPDWLFQRLAQRMLAIDPLARSSMWEDLERGRTTEVAWLNGEVVRLAKQYGRKAPANQRLLALVHEAESGGRRDFSAAELVAALLD